MTADFGFKLVVKHVLAASGFSNGKWMVGLNMAGFYYNCGRLYQRIRVNV